MPPLYGCLIVDIAVGLVTLVSKDRHGDVHAARMVARALVVLLLAAFVGAAFEYFAGWFWETSFGIVAWSYEGQPFNVGHTSLFMAMVWGAVGLLWMKVLLPWFMKVIDLIPMRARGLWSRLCPLLANVIPGNHRLAPTHYARNDRDERRRVSPTVVAANAGVVAAIERRLGQKLIVSDKAQLCGALVAALLARGN